MTDMPRITLLPVGNPDRRALDDLARDLRGMGFDVELVGRRALPQGAFDARRGQFHADALLALALSVRHSNRGCPSTGGPLRTSRAAPSARNRTDRN